MWESLKSGGTLEDEHTQRATRQTHLSLPANSSLASETSQGWLILALEASDFHQLLNHRARDAPIPTMPSLSSSSDPSLSRSSSARTSKKALLDALAAELKLEKAAADEWARRMVAVEDQVRSRLRSNRDLARSLACFERARCCL